MTGDLSYAHGTSGAPLLGDTIGASPDRAVAAFPGREALVDVVCGRRWTYAEFGAAVDEVGENIHPRGIEEFLYGHPGIRDVQVVGVPHEHYGEEVLACVVPRDPADPPTLEDLRAFCDGQLAHYKIPSRLQLLDAFPVTVSGKVRKVELRERFAD